MRKKKNEDPASPASFLTRITPRVTRTADVCRVMVSHLIRNDWSEGQRIPPERELCAQLGVGRASLREALKALEIMGMIETHLGDGTYVCHRSEFLSRPLLWAITGSVFSEISELVEARLLIEGELAGLAAERAGAEDVKEIGDLLDKMEASLDDLVSFQEADVNFHIAVARAAHNQILANALLLIRNLMQEWIGKTLSYQGVAALALEQHNQIFLAIAKRNPERSKATMRQHLSAMATYLEEAETESKVEPDAAELNTSNKVS